MRLFGDTVFCRNCHRSLNTRFVGRIENEVFLRRRHTYSVDQKQNGGGFYDYSFSRFRSITAMGIRFQARFSPGAIGV